ncbi:uncharacterized protein LOC128667996 [Microplitis demolitor]|uniref:uncharacterized protein LOC103571366 n=1 Tax=Microplitis demolitor TaxID=69319 RepID=UPI0004CD304F|nr:uncharacterized protein LOC103571366 [Microplitis demolitor]XP_053596049.1 uncharacterized protein LOC128667996 [Microplitis demolitor]
MMDFFNLSNITLFVLLIIFKLNLSSGELELVTIQKDNPAKLEENGDKANFVRFYSSHAIQMNSNLLNGDIIDSICFDPVKVRDGYVATGARFKKHGRVLYLELQQGPLEGPSGIEPLFLKWTVSNNCNSSKKIVYDRQEETYDITELKLGDMLLPDDAVVTGVTLGKSLRGRYINRWDEFDDSKGEVVRDIDEWDRISFRENKEDTDKGQYINPWIDLQEVVTDPGFPQPINGISFYLRYLPKNQQILALKVTYAIPNHLRMRPL